MRQAVMTAPGQIEFPERAMKVMTVLEKKDAMPRGSASFGAFLTAFSVSQDLVHDDQLQPARL